jgi:flagellar biosynthesis protein FlhF
MMSFRRYIATTVREGLERVRRELGEDAVILSNKRLGPGRIEIVAAASDSMDALVEQADRPNASAPRPAAPAGERADRAQAESFQEFIRRQAPSSALRATEGMPSSTPRATEGRPAAARGTRGGMPAAARSAGEGLPSVARSAGEALPSAARSAEEGVAMYHEVARVQAEPDFGSEPAAEAAGADAAPAVFRQRAAREAELRASATMVGRAPQAGPGAPGGARPTPPPALPEPAAMVASAPTPRPLPARAAPPEPPAVVQSAPVARPVIAAPMPTAPAAAAPATERAESVVMEELRSLRAALSDRIAALESNITVKQAPAAPVAAAPARNPAATRVMTRLLMSGFSPDLARRVAAHAPSTSDIGTMDLWLHEVIAGNLRCASGADGLLESQGALALVGATGVGKTTTVAKLAARFAVRYGASQLGLITLDSYRIGAHEQLRSYGRILGVPMHVAQDGATLRELLASLQGRRLVLIDTCGLSQRDERMEEMLGTLAAARFDMQPIRRVLLLNASSHSETLDEVARAWRAPDAAGAILTKLDEAARIGGAVDCLLRYRMTLCGLTNGQRVPEDWHQAGARLIAHVALKPSTSPFALGDDEAQAWSGEPQGSVHA